MTNDKTCAICLETIYEKNVVSCSNVECDTVICKECCESYINFCSQQLNVLCVCVKGNCNSPIIYKNLIKTKMSEDTMLNYNEIIFNYLKNDKLDNIILDKAKDSFIQKTRETRRQFINGNFPKAISALIDISFKQKLNKVTKSNVKIEKDSIKNKCFNILCTKGILDAKLKCNLCDTIFCEKCKKKKDNKSHKCIESDVLNKNFVDTLIHCPKCNLPILKSSGCRNMTCAVCKTKFDYYTGEISQDGGHSTFFDLRETTKIKPSIDILMITIKES